MNVLAVDVDSAALDFLMRCQAFGHKVAWFNAPHRKGQRVESRVGEGIIENRITDLDALRRKWLGWADLIYLTGNAYYMEFLEPFRKMGYPIYGGNVEAATWESDRAVGQSIMKKAGLSIIPGREFQDHDSAIAYVKKQGVPMVSKPSGDADKSMSYVSTNAADLVYMLERWKKNPKYVSDAKEHGFILQEKKSGCEMGASGWFGPGGFADYWEEDFEYKKLMDGDLGVNTGEQGTLTRFVKRSKLADAVIKPFYDELIRVGYVGCINVNCIIDDEGTPWPLEFTMREGWPAAHNELALTEGDPAQWMVDLLNGHDTRKVRFDTACASVVMSIPDYPYSHLTAKEVCGIPIYNCDDFEHVHLSEVMLGESPCMVTGKVVSAPCYQTAGDYVLICTGTGETINGARNSAYAAIRKVKIPNSPGYRLDIGRGKLVDQLPRIQALGYATGLTYA